MDDKDIEFGKRIHMVLRDAFIDEGAIFFGGYAISNYVKYMPYKQRKLVSKIPDFDVLFSNPEIMAEKIKKKLSENGIDDVSIIKHESVGEILPLHYELIVGKDTVAFIYDTIACHSYNTFFLDKKKVNIATIDTILTFYLAFWYIDEPYYQRDRIMCMVRFLFSLEEKNRLSQRGLLKRFSTTCYGHQETLMNIRAKKSAKFKELDELRGTKEYNMWFLKYNPGEKKKINDKDTKRTKDKLRRNTTHKSKFKSLATKPKKNKKMLIKKASKIYNRSILTDLIHKL
jgi:hypothetical protein